MAVVIDSPISFEASQTGDWQKHYDQAIAEAGDYSELICPHCRTRGTLSPCGHYNRYFYNSSEDHCSGCMIKITVLKCHGTKCGHEHALFPSWICPYSHFSYPFILAILDYLFNEANHNLSETARTFHIGRAEVRNLANKYQEEQNQIREVSHVKSRRLSFLELLQLLRQKADELRAFLEEFILIHAEPFLLRHTGLHGAKTKMTIGQFKAPKDNCDIP